ncbi:hypothetical protein P167DRAFT_604011 [Morchella conica CCBAS932]|uniref:Uncharacterized protein n=1 Tax=Morchella conica CCBAS932 TaxID=1392247 RepID=A0A3N4KVH8_9PEZI|nr:hypothetical protein P167DRAFT_604011 [Morchella conica CCBAS932]
MSPHTADPITQSPFITFTPGNDLLTPEQCEEILQHTSSQPPYQPPPPRPQTPGFFPFPSTIHTKFLQLRWEGRRSRVNLGYALANVCYRRVIHDSIFFKVIDLMDVPPLAADMLGLVQKYTHQVFCDIAGQPQDILQLRMSTETQSLQTDPSTPQSPAAAPNGAITYYSSRTPTHLPLLLLVVVPTSDTTSALEICHKHMLVYAEDYFKRFSYETEYRSYVLCLQGSVVYFSSTKTSRQSVDVFGVKSLFKQCQDHIDQHVLSSFKYDIAEFGQACEFFKVYRYMVGMLVVGEEVACSVHNVLKNIKEEGKCGVAGGGEGCTGKSGGGGGAEPESCASDGKEKGNQQQAETMAPTGNE